MLDGAGEGVPDAIIELWQLAPDGSVPQAEGSFQRDGYTFTGWGRASTDRTGRYQFTTLRPGTPSSGAAPYFGLTVFARGLLDRLFTRAYLPGAAPAAPVEEATDPGLDLLSAREREVMQLLARGYTYREIGSRLFISVKTVESHASNVLRKLQLSNRNELTRWAATNKLL